jgi:hypothetical protein
MQDATGTLEKVVLERIPASHIADKRQMFDHLIRVSALYVTARGTRFPRLNRCAPFPCSKLRHLSQADENVQVRQLNTLYDTVARARA